MATAIAEAGYPLHVWARHPGSLDALGNVAHVRHDASPDLAASCNIVALCVSTDEDVMQIVTGGLLDGIRPGSVIVNHGTGTPRNARSDEPLPDCGCSRFLSHTRLPPTPRASCAAAPPRFRA